jgi:uncharacterized protein
METQKFYQIERKSKISKNDLRDFFVQMETKIWGDLIDEQLPFGLLSSNLEKSVVRQSSDEIPDCETCGLCCSMFPSVQLTSKDDVSPANYWEITVNSNNGDEIVVDKLLRRDGETGSCISLSGTVGERVGCKIYLERPTACRKFEAGSDRCHSLRRLSGLEKTLDPIESILAIQKLHEKTVSEKPTITQTFIEKTENDSLEINISIEDSPLISLYVFDPKKESWLEGDFFGLTLAEAQNLIKK